VISTKSIGLSFLLIIGFVSGNVIAEPVVINGIVPGAENNEIRLMQYADRISYRLMMVDRVQVSDSATFTLHADVIAPVQFILDIDFYTAVIYVYPGSVYHIICEPVDIAGQYRPFYKKDLLVYSIVDEPDPPINTQIREFENIYAALIEQELSGPYQKRNTTFIKKFRQEMDSVPGYHPVSFVKNYMDYRLASLEFIIAPVKRIPLFKAYIQDKPILYDQPEYMTFFNSFFEDYLLQNSKFISRRDLMVTINQMANYRALLDTLGKDTLLRNEVIRELVWLRSVVDLYNDPSYSKKNLIDMLDQMADLTKFNDHREIAGNLKKSLTQLQQGTYAPAFNLPDLDMDTLNLSDFSGKPLYLSFFTTWSYACLAEFELMDSLYQRYGDRIHFVTISLDKTKSVVDRLRKEKNYNWIFLFNGSGYDIIHDYNVKTFPSFVLIDAEGKIVDYPAYKPSEVIEDRFRYVLNMQQ
jgi:thiol-disulfide isomerase/thioredoxin